MENPKVTSLLKWVARKLPALIDAGGQWRIVIDYGPAGFKAQVVTFEEIKA